MKKVAILTTFLEYDAAYSLINVVSDQVKMLLMHNYSPTVIVCESFNPENAGVFSDERVTIKKIPNFPLDNSGNFDNFDEIVNGIKTPLFEILKDTDVCITHDIVYQWAHLPHNQASRLVAKELPNIKWLHWIHSCPDEPQKFDNYKALRYQRFPNSFYVYPNSLDTPRVMKMFDLEETDVKEVNHPIDVCEYLGFQEITKKLVADKNMLEADVIGIYPLRMDRGKQPEKVIKTFGALKKIGLSVRLVICNFHGTGEPFVSFKNECKQIGVDWGLNDNDLTFTSEFDDSTHVRCPREMVRDLLLLSNVFIQSSTSETYSLVVQEAALCGNILVLNQDFPPMRQIYGDKPIYKPFSSNINALTHGFGTTTTDVGNEKEFYEGIAKHIRYYLSYDKAIAMKTKIRKERNLKTVFRKQLEPLLYANS